MQDSRWLWNEPLRLECRGEWRVTTRQADGIPYYTDGRHLQTLLFGQESHFQSADRIPEILRSIGIRLGLDSAAWKWQSPFYAAFLQSLFRPCEAPAWIKIANSRLSFRQRIDGPRGLARHFGCGSRRLFRAKHLGRETLTLNDSALPTNYLRMRYRSDIPMGELGLYEVTIFRTLTDDGFGGPLSCHERWLHLGSPDREERTARKKGVNLVLKDYPANDPLGRMAPLVSLCRFTDDREWVVSRCVSLCPGTGEALDFRSVIHRTEFYFRSDLSNAVLLSQAVTPGQSERFVYG